MSSSHREATGSLFVDTGKLSLPVEIRDKGLRVVQRVFGHEEISLLAGFYVLSVKSLTGKLTETVQLEAGQRLSITLNPDREPSALVPEHRAKGPRQGLPGRVARRHPLGEVGAQGADEGTSRFRIRFHRLSTFEQGAIVPAPRLEPLGAGAGGFELGLWVNSQEVVFAQIAAAGVPSIHLALPALGENERLCRVQVARDAGEISASAYPGDQVTEFAARHLLAGSLEEAADLIGRNLRQGGSPPEDPVAATLAGYLMLRLGEHGVLQGWPERLARQFESLPDGAILAGERAARTGDHTAAQAFFEVAVARGLPLFTDGYSMLLSRLRQYALAAGQAETPLLKRLESGGRFIDFGTLTLTFRDEGSGTAEPDEEGWIATPR